MVLPVLIVKETVLEARNVPVSNKTHVHTGPDGVPGPLQHHHATLQRDARPVPATVVTQITAKDQLNVAKMLSCQTYHAQQLPSNCPLNSAAHGPIHSVVSSEQFNNADHAIHSNNETLSSQKFHFHCLFVKFAFLHHHGKKSNKNVTRVSDVSGSVSPNVTRKSKTELLFGEVSHLNTKKKWFQQSALIGWKFNLALVL